MVGGSHKNIRTYELQIHLDKLDLKWTNAERAGTEARLVEACKTIAIMSH